MRARRDSRACCRSTGSRGPREATVFGRSQPKRRFLLCALRHAPREGDDRPVLAAPLEGRGTSRCAQEALYGGRVRRRALLSCAGWTIRSSGDLSVWRWQTRRRGPATALESLASLRSKGSGSCSSRGRPGSSRFRLGRSSQRVTGHRCATFLRGTGERSGEPSRRESGPPSYAVGNRQPEIVERGRNRVEWTTRGGPPTSAGY